MSLKEIIPCHAGILICSGTVGIYGNIEDIPVTLFRIFFIKLLELKCCELRMNGKLSGTTKIIVAQRISTIRHADKIIVLDRGETVGIGTHEELMKNCDVYREIATSQLSAAELA